MYTHTHICCLVGEHSKNYLCKSFVVTCIAAFVFLNLIAPELLFVLTVKGVDCRHFEKADSLWRKQNILRRNHIDTALTVHI